MTSAYPKVLQLGDRNVADIFEGIVEISEKVDGSQIGWGLVPSYYSHAGGISTRDLQLVIRSHHREFYRDGWLGHKDKMFAPAVASIEAARAKLRPGWMYYGETLCKPHHSTLVYDRVPRGNIALFGMQIEDGTWLDHPTIMAWAAQLHIDFVPMLYQGANGNVHAAFELLETPSILGGQTVEGVVIKRYIPEGRLIFGVPQYVLAAKYVSERFKEVHKDSWTKDNTAKGGVEKLCADVRTEARWMKAVQHLRERGEFDGSVRMIGPLMREVSSDLELEETEALKDALWKLYRGDILRSSTSGLPEWFKQQLALGAYL
jgi:hypothetical protein